MKIVKHLMSEKITWIDRDGVSKQLQQEDILIIAPYNAFSVWGHSSHYQYLINKETLVNYLIT